MVRIRLGSRNIQGQGEKTDFLFRSVVGLFRYECPAQSVLPPELAQISGHHRCLCLVSELFTAQKGLYAF